MSDLIHESNRLMLLSALRHVKPETLREIMKDQPDESRVVSALKARNDSLHHNLRQIADVAPDRDTSTNNEAPNKSTNVQPLSRRRPFDSASSQVRELFSK